MHLGIDWTEAHRLRRAEARPEWKGWTLRAPLCDAASYHTKDDLRHALAVFGIAIPRLYRLGFAHNNCGFCVKAGQASHALLYRTLPDRARWHARQEQRLRRELGKNVAILRDRRGGHTRPLTLAELHRRVVAAIDATDPGDISGCGCAL